MSSTYQFVFLLLLASLAGLFVRRAVSSALREPSRFPRANWGIPEAILALGLSGFFLAMAAASSRAASAEIDIDTVLSSVVLYGGITGLICVFLSVRRLPLIETFGLRWTAWRSEWRAIPITLLLVFPFIHLVQWLAYQVTGPSSEPQPIVTFLLDNPGLQARLAVAAVAVVAAPITEELIFRGCLYGVCRSFAGRWAAIFFTSVVFALIHGHLASLPGLFLLAVALCLIYEKTGSLWAPIGLHALFNGLTVTAAILFPDIAK